MDPFLGPQISSALAGLSQPLDLTQLPSLLPIFDKQSSPFVEEFISPAPLAQQVLEGAVKEVLAKNPHLGFLHARRFIPKSFSDKQLASVRETFTSSNCLPVTSLPSHAAQKNILAHAAEVLAVPEAELLSTPRFIFSRPAMEPVLSALLSVASCTTSLVTPLRPLLPLPLVESREPTTQDDDVPDECLQLLHALAASSDVSLTSLTIQALPSLINTPEHDPALTKKSATKKRSKASTLVLILPTCLAAFPPSLLTSASKVVHQAAIATATEESVKVHEATVTGSGNSAQLKTLKPRHADHAVTAKALQTVVDRALSPSLPTDTMTEEERRAFVVELITAVLLPYARSVYTDTLQSLLSNEADRRRQVQEDAEAGLGSSVRRAVSCLHGAQFLFDFKEDESPTNQLLDRHMVRVMGTELLHGLLRVTLLNQQQLPPALVERHMTELATAPASTASQRLDDCIQSVAHGPMRLGLAEIASLVAGARGFLQLLSKVEDAAKTSCGLTFKRPDKKADVARASREYELYLKERLSLAIPSVQQGNDPALHAQVMSLLVFKAVAARLKVSVNVPGKSLTELIAKLEDEAGSEDDGVAALRAYHDAVLRALGGDSAAAQSLPSLLQQAAA